MRKIDNRDESPFLGLLMLVLMLVAGTTVAVGVGYLLEKQLLGSQGVSMMAIQGRPLDYRNFLVEVTIIQGAMSLCILALPPTLYALWERRNLTGVLSGNVMGGKVWPLVVLLMLCAYPAISYIGLWNAKMQLPDALKWLEDWMRNLEDQNAEMTLLLTSFETVPEFLLGLVVIAGVAAFGEEFIFRGVLQPLISRVFNPKVDEDVLGAGHKTSGKILLGDHIAVWVTAILFSAIHLQFFGFFPRMLLGALFGYLYLWSKDLRVPMLAHFVNNGFIVLMLYLSNTGKIQVDLEHDYEPSVWVALASIFFSGVILSYLYSIKKKSVMY